MRKVLAVPTFPAVATVTRIYDAFGRLATQTDGIGTTTYGYHPINPNDAIAGDGKLAFIDGPWSNDTIAYTYDELGRTVLRTINGSANQIATIYDSDGRVSQIANNLGSFDYSYEPHSDQLNAVTSNLGRITQFSYKGVLEDLRLDSIENYATTGSLLSKFTYGYDKLSRITEWGQKQDGGVREPTPHTMRYDRSSRLTQMTKAESTGDGKQWNWRFDRAGNRLAEQVEAFDSLASTVQRKQYAVNVADQLTGSSSGGPLHVSGELDEPGKVEQAPVGGRAVPDFLTEETSHTFPLTEETSHTFSAWAPQGPTSATANLVVRDWNGNTTSAQVQVDAATPPPPTRTLTYDSNGNLTQMVWG